MKLIKTRLRNGSELITIPSADSTSVYASVWIKAGWRYDPLGKDGLAHFLEHILLRNTKRFPKANYQAEFIENKGGYGNAYTGLNYTYHWIRIAPDYIKDSLELLVDRLQNPLFKEEEIEKEKSIVAEEISLNNANPQRHIWDLFFAHLYQGTALDRSYSGTKETILRINPTDLKEFHYKYYQPNRILFVISGKCSPEIVKDLLNQNLEALKQKDRPLKEENYSLINNKPNIRLETQDSPQETFMVAFRTDNIFTGNRQQLQLLITLLAGGFGSRIGRKFGKQGLIYSWYPYAYQWQDMGYVGLQTSVEPNKFNKVVNIILGEFMNFSSSKITALELERAKAFYKGKLLVDMDSPEKKALWIGEQIFLEFPSLLTPEEEAESIDFLTSQDIIDVARKYLIKDNALITGVGPIKLDDIKLKI